MTILITARRHVRSLLSLLSALMLCAVLVPGSAQAACSTMGCVSAGPRLASIDSTRGALLNA
ncbi:MAG: hypothetical protein ABW220_10465, partial [Burkholderiaceae bacterium]